MHKQCGPGGREERRGGKKMGGGGKRKQAGEKIGTSFHTPHLHTQWR